MTDTKPNIIFSSFARSVSSAIDAVLKPILTSIGYYVTPFGIEGSQTICDEIAGVHDPFYHHTHAPPSLFQPLISRADYRFVYQYRDPRDSVVSWAYNEISEGNIEGEVDIDHIRNRIIISRFHLAEHVMRAREWFELEDRLCRLSFEEMRIDKALAVQKVLDFIGISNLIEPNTIQSALEKFSDQNYMKSLEVKEARLIQLNLSRKKRGVSGSWVDVFTPVDKLLFKKTAGDFLVELGYEKDLDW